VENGRIVLDSGALTALAQDKEKIRIALQKAIAAGAHVAVPTAVIAESTTGDSRRDAPTNRVLKLASSAGLDERLARRAAALRYAARLRQAGTIDAIVVATADDVAGSVIFTTDPRDMTHLTSITARSRVDAF
jgi:predicted nucleic acid-binding protein